MSMFARIRAALLRRWHQEDGAVTVDWVVLTALVITMCLALATLMDDAYTTGGTAISDAMNAPQD